MVAILAREENPNIEYLNPEIERKSFFEDELEVLRKQKDLKKTEELKKLTFSDSQIEKILNKLSSKRNFELTDNEVAQGVVPNPDIIGSSNIKKISKTKIKKYNIKKGDGVFVVPRNFFKTLKKYESNIIKPLYEPTDLCRYFVKPENSKEIIYLTKEVNNENNMPTLLQHLSKFREIMDDRRENKNNRLKYYHLHWPRDKSFFESGSKILSIRKCIYPVFSYTEKPMYVMMSINIIKTNRINQKYLTGILNSKLIAFWLRHKGKMQGSNYQIDKEPIMAIPVFKAPDRDQLPLIRLVDEILTITETEDYPNNQKEQNQISECENQINQLVYKFYDLTEEEIKIVEDFLKVLAKRNKPKSNKKGSS